MAFTTEELHTISVLKYQAEKVIEGFMSALRVENNISLYPAIKEHLVLSGGSFSSWAHNEDARDWDIFVLSSIESGLQAHGFVPSTLDNLLRVLEPRQGSEAHYKNPMIKAVWTIPDTKFQVIFSRFETREDLIKDFDYKHCTISYHNGKLYLTENVLRAIMKKELIINNPKNLAMYRQNKFIDRGYKGTNENIVFKSTGVYGSTISNPISVGANGPSGPVPPKIPTTVDYDLEEADDAAFDAAKYMEMIVEEWKKSGKTEGLLEYIKTNAYKNVFDRLTTK